ncbi:ORF6N domain-containing protein [Calditrichota bacterium]
MIRICKVMIDRDLAELYGVETKRLNEQVKRNIDRFPDDFVFQLTENEKTEVVVICDRPVNKNTVDYLHHCRITLTKHFES